MKHISAVLAELDLCGRCLANAHICPICETATSHGITLCPSCDTQLEQEAA